MTEVPGRCPYCNSKLFPEQEAYALFKALKACEEESVDVVLLAGCLLDYAVDYASGFGELDWLATVHDVLEVIADTAAQLAQQCEV